MFERPGLIFAALAAIFWWVTIAFIPPPIQIELQSALLLPLAGIALWRWGPGGLRNIAAKQITPGMILTIAVATMAFAIAFQSIWHLVYRWLSRPQSMADSGWVGFPIFLGVIMLILYLVATRRETDPPMPMLMWVIGIVAFFLLITGLAARLLM